MRIIRRWRWWHGQRPDGPFVADYRSFDIPETVAAMIRNAPPNCVAVTLRPRGGQRMTAAAERAARRKGIRILWVLSRVAMASD